MKKIAERKKTYKMTKKDKRKSEKAINHLGVAVNCQASSLAVFLFKSTIDFCHDC